MPVLKNAKHERFAQEISKGATADEAYALAGYSPHRSNAARMSANEHIRSRVEEILSKAADKVGVTVERVISELAKIGFADIRKAVAWGAGIAVADETGQVHVVNDVALISSEQIDPDTAAAISEVRKTKDGVAIKFHDKQAALVNLGKHLGLFKDRVELTGRDGGPIKTEQGPDLSGLPIEDLAALEAILAKASAEPSSGS
ncbi:terminase small subunit [Alsobacter sp. KACC 23698]|uniref:Terminase small subunit n=1 Tax=Alsobacter sp. KACC 23698 TaxID=3149229 RepID=A0AAU7J8L1_9HYPH